MARWRFDLVWLLVIGTASSAYCLATAHAIGATYDEPVYLEQGLHYWRTGSHRQLMKMGTMPLPVDLQALPLAIAERIRGIAWDLQSDFHRVLPWARAANLVFWWLLLGGAMLLGRQLGGPWAGRWSAAALAFEPNFLAHAALATTDIAVTACLVVFVFVYCRGRDGDRVSRIGWPGFWFGLALLSKASALVFAPFAMLAVEVTRTDPRGWRERLRSFVADGIAIGCIGLMLAFIGCGTDFRSQRSFVAWAESLPSNPGSAALVWIAKHLKIFGNAGEAIVMQIRHNLRGHGQFLLGESGDRPFWYYFPVLFAIKLTAPVLLGGFLLALRPKAVLKNSALVLFAMLLLFSLKCRVQIGIRLQLPALAFLTIGLAVALEQVASQTRLLRAIAACGIAVIVTSSLAIWPHALTYANSLTGGSDRAYRLMSDSNYDWGQGLAELAQWHDENQRPGLDVWYFGQDPRLKEMPVRSLPVHCLSLGTPDDLGRFCWGRYLAVGTSVRYGFILSPAHQLALAFLDQRLPVARTTTFLIYDLTDIGPPPVANAEPGRERE